jgi:hypothetical protein
MYCLSLLPLFISSFLLCVGHVLAEQSTPLVNSPQAYFGGANHAAYLDWVESYGNEYYQSTFLASAVDPTLGVAIHYRVQDDRIYLAVAAKAQGWVGLGFSENGGMVGSDMILFEAATNTLTDAYATQEAPPLVDDCQDWSLTRSFVDDADFIIFEANRLLTTQDDAQDRPFLPDALESSAASLTIAAWGNSDDVSYHGTTNRSRGTVRWYRTGEEEVTSFAQAMDMQSDGVFEFAAIDYAISTEETQYIWFCLSRDELIAKGVPMDSESLYLIGFEPIVDPRAAPYVHHFTVYQSEDETITNCQNEEMGSAIYAWAPGEQPMALPDNVGMPFGDVLGGKSIRMQIHYNNPQGVANILDSSGVRYFFTTKPREHELGSAGFGDPLVLLRGQDVGQGLMQHSFSCPSSCTESVLDSSGVTVLKLFHHMHETGAAARNELIRDGKVIRSNQVDYFDFKQQGNQLVQGEPFQILPGDELKVTCEYKSNDSRVFGLASQEEMCMSQILYYPRKRMLQDRATWACVYAPPSAPFEIPCSTQHENRTLSSEEDMGRTFGQSRSDGVCPYEVEEEVPADGELDDVGGETSDCVVARAHVVAIISLAVLAAVAI